MSPRTQLTIRMTEAKARLLERKMLPRAYYLTETDFEAFGKDAFDFIPVRQRVGDGASALFSSHGCIVQVPARL